MRAIRNDILLSGFHEAIFGVNRGKGTLKALLDELAELNLLPNNSKFQGFIVNEASSFQIPSWIKQPKVFKEDEGTWEEAHLFWAQILQPRLETKNM
jgi:hypothetical protein